MFIRSAVVAIVAVAGCGSVTTYQSAETLAPGRWQGMAALGGGSFADRDQMSRTPTINAEVGARRGIVDGTDLGLKLYTIGIEASVRQRLATGTWSWALLGAIGGSRSTDRWGLAVPNAVLAQLRIGVVATRRTSPTWAWSVGPVTTGSLWIPEGGGHGEGVLLGGFGGFDWRFGAKWHLVPEVSLHRTLAGVIPVHGTVAELGAAFTRDF
jgi:hypothetical protein